VYQEQLDKCDEVLSALGGVTAMHAPYYRVSAEWNKVGNLYSGGQNGQAQMGGIAGCTTPWYL